ncbi:Bcr/CflA family efflux MFS transporter [Streptomyces kanamyceticus]|uniref:Bcr/CflA family efflux MFS transporter n=1 Tax=Streptomyces kanamyceticus TaxID=1967 RepID=UPI0006E37497|nr:Bcr/CflA family efflux MFS transporter [Streptomyces kanamyceticus]
MPLLTAALALLSFIGPLSTDMYLPAFPRMAEELGTDASGVQLTLTAFLVGMTVGHLVFGPLSDRYGRRGPLLAGAAVCTVGTALCAVAPSLGWLVALRFLTGFSGAAGVVISRAVVSDVVQGAAAARLFGVLMTLAGIAPILAPLAGGAVIGGAGWRGVFWVLTGVSALVALAVVVGVPESLPRERRHAGGMRRTAAAVREVLGDRAYVGYTLAFTFGFGMLFCYIAGSPFLLQNVLGMGVGASSVAFSGGAVVATLSSAVGARLVGWALGDARRVVRAAGARGGRRALRRRVPAVAGFRVRGLRSGGRQLGRVGAGQGAGGGRRGIRAARHGAECAGRGGRAAGGGRWGAHRGADVLRDGSVQWCGPGGGSGGGTGTGCSSP